MITCEDLSGVKIITRHTRELECEWTIMCWETMYSEYLLSPTSVPQRMGNHHDHPQHPQQQLRHHRHLHHHHFSHSLYQQLFHMS